MVGATAFREVAAAAHPLRLEQPEQAEKETVKSPSSVSQHDPTFDLDPFFLKPPKKYTLMAIAAQAMMTASNIQLPMLIPAI